MLSEEIEKLENYCGENKMPGDFREYWEEILKKDFFADQIQSETVRFENREAVYERLVCPAFDGKELKVRVIRPVQNQKYPVVLMFHDQACGIRGWHHMTRFAGIGFGVIALENRVADCGRGSIWSANALRSCVADALWTVKLTGKLPWVDQSKFHTWGEGFGGALAMAAAAWIPQGCKCAVRNPFPADLHFCAEEEKLGEYVNILNFAEYIRGKFLLGTGMMDEFSSVKGQFAAFSRVACTKRHLKYPKYGHERINHFENEVLKFFSFSETKEESV